MTGEEWSGHLTADRPAQLAGVDALLAMASGRHPPDAPQELSAEVATYAQPAYRKLIHEQTTYREPVYGGPTSRGPVYGQATYAGTATFEQLYSRMPPDEGIPDVLDRQAAVVAAPNTAGPRQSEKLRGQLARWKPPWFEAVCRASAAEHIGSVYWWEVNFDANPASPGPFQSDRITFLGRSGQHAIKTCFARLNGAGR